VDPKTVLCQFFKSGQCQKGDKCKFSHDLNIERKSAKIDLYTDSRSEEDKKVGKKILYYSIFFFMITMLG